MNRLEHAGLVHTDPARPRRGGHRLRRRGDRVRHRRRRRTTARSASTSTASRVPTLLEDARAPGKATGLVTTSQVTDATPAAYAAHVTDRAQQSEIARQFLEELQARRDPRRRRGLLVPGGQPGRAARPPADRPDRGEQGRPREPRRPRQELGYRYVSDRAGLASATRPASCSACSPTRRCSSTARRARATSTSPRSRCPRWRPRRSTSSPRTATASSC